MDIVTILRDLWRVRLLVAVVFLLALVAGTAVVYKISFPATLESRKYEVGIATARMLVDTPSSQVVEVSPKGSDSLGVRANLLANLMADGVVKQSIARRAGLKPEKLLAFSDAASAPSAAATTPTPKDFVLTTYVVTNSGGDELPIIEIEAQAPDRQGAAKLGAAAIDGLRDYLDSTAALQHVPDANRLKVTSLGRPLAADVVRGPSTVLAVIVVIFVFGLGCAGILGVLAISRGWRAASEREARGEVPVAMPEPAPEPEEFFDDFPEPAAPRPARPATQRPALVVTPPDLPPKLAPKPANASESWLTGPAPAPPPPTRPSLVVPPGDKRAESA